MASFSYQFSGCHSFPVNYVDVQKPTVLNILLSFQLDLKDILLRNKCTTKKWATILQSRSEWDDKVLGEVSVLWERHNTLQESSYLITLIRIRPKKIVIVIYSHILVMLVIQYNRGRSEEFKNAKVVGVGCYLMRLSRCHKILAFSFIMRSVTSSHCFQFGGWNSFSINHVTSHKSQKKELNHSKAVCKTSELTQVRWKSSYHSESSRSVVLRLCGLKQ